MRIVKAVWFLSLLLVPSMLSTFSNENKAVACEYPEYYNEYCGCSSSCNGFDYCVPMTNSFCFIN